jgi:hypothetical protein
MSSTYSNDYYVIYLYSQLMSQMSLDPGVGTSGTQYDAPHASSYDTHGQGWNQKQSVGGARVKKIKYLSKKNIIFYCTNFIFQRTKGVPGRRLAPTLVKPLLMVHPPECPLDAGTTEGKTQAPSP